MIKQTITKAINRENLSESEMRATMAEILDGAAPPVLIGAFLTALRMKQETVEEITGFRPEEFLKEQDAAGVKCELDTAGKKAYSYFAFLKRPVTHRYDAIVETTAFADVQIGQ